MALKFVKNGLKNHNFSKLFPLRKAKHEMSFRNSERFHVKITKTGRHKDSAVPFLQRLLNKDTLIKKENLKMLIDHSKKLEKSEMKNSRVNYICNVDVITYENKNFLLTYLHGVTYISFLQVHELACSSLSLHEVP